MYDNLFKKTVISCLLFSCFICIRAQVDSTKVKLSFNLGITRGQNIYLRPFIRKIKEGKEKDLQIAFTIIQSKRNYTDTTKHSHLLPLLWKDSTTDQKDIRLFTTYYPSVFRVNNNYKTHVMSYRFMELAPDISLIEFSRSKDGSYLKNNLLFFLWYRNDQLSKRSHLIVFPLYNKQSDSISGSSSKSYLLSLYSKFKRRIPNTTFYYEEEKILWFIRIRSNYKRLKAMGIINEKP